LRGVVASSPSESDHLFDTNSSSSICPTVFFHPPGSLMQIFRCTGGVPMPMKQDELDRELDRTKDELYRAFPCINSQWHLLWEMTNDLAAQVIRIDLQASPPARTD
jgi:hypothetical protein